MQVCDCRILENLRIEKDFFRMTISAPQIAERSEAGQFLHLRCNDSQRILRRPFSIHRVIRDRIQILYRVVGSGSLEFSEKKKEETVDVLGPLGTGFKIPEDIKKIIIIAGGMGVAPLLMLADKIKSIRTIKRQSVTVLIGAKTKEEILCEKEFQKLGFKVHVATDNGSKGHKGLVTDLLKSLLCTPYSVPCTAVYACGPKPMLLGTAEICLSHKVPTQVSMEERMACGIGVCYGCSVSTIDGYKLVCKDGPVFDAQEIIWD